MAETPSPDPVLNAVRDRLPVALGAYDTQDRIVDLVIVDVVPVIDVKRERQDIVAVGEIGKQRVGRRTRTASLGGEQLDHL